MDGIRKYQKSAQNHDCEIFTIGMAEEILRNTNIAENEDYFFFCEYPIRNALRRINDKESDIVLLEIIKSNVEETLLTIRCTHKDEDAKDSFYLHLIMDEIDCKYGISISPNVAIIYKKNGNKNFEKIGSELDLSKDNDINFLIQFINIIS